MLSTDQRSQPFALSRWFVLLPRHHARAELGCHVLSRSRRRNVPDEETQTKTQKSEAKGQTGEGARCDLRQGGVGKTTSTAALGAALAQIGQKVVVVDFDIGLRNLDLILGAERRVVYDLINVIKGDAKLAQALIRDKRLETLSLLPASQSRDKDNLPRKASRAS